MKVLIIDKVHEILPQGLRRMGIEVSDKPLISRAELLSEIGSYEGLIVRTKTRIDKDVLSNAARLRFIGRAGSGTDNIDTQWCVDHGIACFNSGEANADAVGEQAVGMLLSLLANIVKGDREVRQGVWDREGNTGTELGGMTVGIIGYGNTGKAVARKLSGFNVKVLAYDRFLNDYGDRFAAQSTLDGIFEQADVLTLHVPLTDLTRGMVTEAFLSRFRKPVVLMNLSRGGVVNTREVAAMLKEGRLRGACLDVLENEDPQRMNDEEKLWFAALQQASNVVLTPHVGGWTVQSFRKISEVLLQKITDLKLQ